MNQREGDSPEWVTRLRAGEAEAWNEMFDRFGQRVWRIICRAGGFKAGEEDQVEDIRQETFLAAIKAIQQYRGSASVGTWLHRLAVNKTIDHIRKRQRSPQVAAPDAPDPDTGEPEFSLADPINTPADDLMRKELHARLRQCLEILRAQNEQWWSIVMMHHFGDLLYKDVAQALGLPLGTVQGTLHRARLVLADCVGGNKPGDPDDQ